MLTIVRDWLLDPLGLVVLWTALLLLGGVILGGRRRRARAGAGSDRGSGRGSTRRRRGPGPGARLLRRAGLLALWYAGLAAVSAPAIVNPLVASLERAVPAGRCAPGTPVVALGGGIDSSARDASRFEAMRRATLGRAAEAGRLAAAEPGVRVVVAGGGAGEVSEAAMMAEWLARTGTPRASILVEDESTSTAENARAVAAMLADAGAREIRLVTSALHMPRAAGAFRAAGLDPCPVPVDRISLDGVPAWALWPQTTALAKFDEWLHEFLATILYRRRGDLADEVADAPTASAAGDAAGPSAVRASDRRSGQAS